MAVQNSLANRQTKTGMGCIPDAGCSKETDQQCGWWKEWDKIHFQYCISSSDNTGSAGVYKSKHPVSSITQEKH